MGRLLLSAVSLLLFVGCAHEEDTTVASSASANAPSFTMTTPVAPAVQVAQAEPPAVTPRRLDHVVTLGEADYSPAAEYGPVSPPGGVTVINNVNVDSGYGNGYGGYYGGYYGGGYSRGGGRGYTTGNGARGGEFGRTGSSTSRSGSSGTSAPHQAWAPNGWEGAGRTAAPGQTPHVGGNYSPPPSYGPAPMR